MTRRVLVLQHMSDDGLGRFAEVFHDDGFAVETIHLHAGQSMPDLGQYDLMLSLGGAMDVWQTDEHPWLIEAEQIIHEWVAKRVKPFIGICLGHQLLASALGGKVRTADRSEVGLGGISIEPKCDHAFLEGLQQNQHVMQWHHCEVTQAPEHATILASSDACAIQAIAVGKHALGVQFHFEWTNHGIRNWPQGWLDALHRELGKDAHEKVVADAAQHMPQMEHLMKSLYGNFKRANGL